MRGSATEPMFQHTAARRRLVLHSEGYLIAPRFQHTAARRRLADIDQTSDQPISFNTQPPEGGWDSGDFWPVIDLDVSTHSRPKAAGGNGTKEISWAWVSTHSRPKAAGGEADIYQAAADVSTHSRPKAAGRRKVSLCACSMFQHTAARRRLEDAIMQGVPLPKFQHTAARRRLGFRPFQYQALHGFNTQPPEGGWSLS